MHGNGRRIAVTGASSGIGAATARLFAERGWSVVATARRDEDIARLRDAGYDALHLELGDADSVARAADAMVAGGVPDVLVNNAGFGLVKAVEETTREDWQRLLDANVIGHFDLTRRLLPAMRERGSGRVLFVGSPVGRDGIPMFGAYAAAKAAEATASDALRVEARPWGVHVSLVEPGMVATRFAETALAPATPSEATARSPYAGTYGRLARFDALLRKGSTPDAVARAIHRAATRRRPPARVPVGALANLARFRGLVPPPLRRAIYAGALGLTLDRTRPPS